MCALDTVGPDRLRLGSHWPHVIGDLASALRTVRALALDDRAQAGILGPAPRRSWVSRPRSAAGRQSRPLHQLGRPRGPAGRHCSGPISASGQGNSCHLTSHDPGWLGRLDLRRLARQRVHEGV